MPSVFMIVAALIAAQPAAPSVAEPSRAAADGWAQLTRADVEAAYRLLLDNHPGAAPEVGDRTFVARLDEAHRTALARSERVTSFSGYSAVMAGMATSFEDEHIWSNPSLRGIPYRWVGLVMARRTGAWVVASDVNEGSSARLDGATLKECDGVPAHDVARAQLAFRVSAPLEAQYVSHGGLLFVDDGNPFLARPERCTFTTVEGKTVNSELDWRPVATATLAAALQPSTGSAAAGFGVTSVGETSWVALERLDDRAETVLDAFEKERVRWLSTPTIVIDVRGNGGGDSRHARRLAELIYGDDHVAARLVDPSICGAAWRASAGNARHLRALAAEAGEGDRAASLAALADQLDAAIAAGEPFAPALPICEEGDTASEAPAVPPAPDYSGRVVLLTDHACFSSCLLLVRDFLRLGALHVGEATNASTRYMEVREIDLPSGLSRFSTLQKILVGGDAEIGPFVPHAKPPQGAVEPVDVAAWVVKLERP